ncbi:MAG TPA: hypothetical protein VF081_02550 [Solirubrobacterales bacterium]
MAIFQATAAAAVPELLTQFPEPPARGGGANQLDAPFAVATDPGTGHVYVAEASNDRISEFDPWGAFVKAWGWGVEDGSGELQVCGPVNAEISPTSTLCQEGIRGSGAGQFNFPDGLAVDAGGSVYVLERGNARVQKFNSAGQFQLMVGGEVNKTTGENVCTRSQLESGDTCGIGIAGAGPGQFSFPNAVTGDIVDVGSDGTVYVGDKGRVELFEPNGAFKGEITLPDDSFVDALAIDPVSGDVYVVPLAPGIQPDKNQGILRLDPETGDLLDTIQVDAPEVGRVSALATDSAGNFFTNFEPNSGEFPPRILEFDASGDELIGFAEEFGAFRGNVGDNASLRAMDTNSVGDLYVAKTNSLLDGDPRLVQAVAAYGPPPIALAQPPLIPPAIVEQFATTAGTASATLKARINPRFWDDTRYYVEFGTADCAADACQQQPAAPGSILTSQIVNSPLLSGGVSLKGLTPNTTYHYRFVAESTGGGPVLGPDRTFTTAAVVPKQPVCEGNQAFRPGAAAFLPDCRAYEMVSPVDKNGADISLVLNSLEDPVGLDQGRPDGNALTYSAFRAFGEVESSPYTSQYLSTRTGSGWTNKGISPPRAGVSIYEGGASLDSQYKGFSSDLCSGWVLQDTRASLAEGAVPDLPNLYRRDLCAGGYSALAPLVPPTVKEAKEFRPEVQGFSADGFRAIFVADGKLTNNASTASQLYESTPGGLRLVCILPNKSALKTACSAGSAGGNGAHPDRSASLSHAISEDGSTIYWSEGELEPGKLFVRLNHADTIAVSTGSAQFWAAAADGSRAFYSEGSGLFEFDLASETSSPIAAGFRGFVAASDDATKAYFVAEEARAPGATAGEPNLYRFEAGAPDGTFEYIATLAEADVNEPTLVPSSVGRWPIRHTGRATPDGSAVTFMSTASLTGYDNVDVASGQADTEVFLYRAGPETLVCVSCNPTGARPAGQDIKDEFRLRRSLWVAGQLPAAENQLHYPRVLSDDGTRLFFESFDPLVLRDTNSQQDVYEWEATGAGNCSEGSPGFHQSLGGCVNLISSGDNPQGSELVDASADGRDVFFKTAASLLPQDPDLIDVYDARAGGGFPLPEPPLPPCLGEACQNPPPAPNDPTPSSQTFVGPGDEQLQCRKGTHVVTKGGEARCVKNRKPKKKRGGKANKDRRTHR